MVSAALDSAAGVASATGVASAAGAGSAAALAATGAAFLDLSGKTKEATMPKPKMTAMTISEV